MTNLPLVEDPDNDTNEIVLHPVSSSSVEFFEPLNETDARALTDTIKSAVDVVWVLISRAHAGKAWVALGYETWADYVGEEFNMSRSRSYQLLDQSRVVREIEAAVPEGTTVNINEATARDLKGVLEEVLPEIRERVAGLDPDQASDVLSEIVEEQRERLREQREADIADAAINDDYFDEDDYGDNGYPSNGGGGGYGNGNGSGNYPLPPMPPEDTTTAMDDVDIVEIRRNVNAAHDLFSSLSALAGLPEDLLKVFDIIPPERYAQIERNLPIAKERLDEFLRIWDSRNSETNDDYDDFDE